MALNKNFAWIPSLYFTEGLPYVIVMTVAVIFYKNLGISNTDIAFYTSWLYLPWVIKPLWSPIVDLMGKKRAWIIITQLLMGGLIASLALFTATPYFFKTTLIVFWLLAFSSATHDIAADGFYMIALSEKDQSFFVGIRSIFYRVSMIVGQGLLVWISGKLIALTGSAIEAWVLVFISTAILLILIAAYHFFVLSRPKEDDITKVNEAGEKRSLWLLLSSFFKKKGIIVSLLFVLFYRFGEAQLAKLTAPFLLDGIEKGGLGLTNEQVGLAYGTIGVVALLLGGMLGGIVVSRDGLKKWLYPMVAMMNLPNLVYVFLALYQPTNIYVIASGIALEQFGYGFGFTAFMLYLIYISKGEFKTSHYALCTGFMALGMMVPGLFAGYIQEWLGYTNFFVWVCLCTIPGIILSMFLKIDPSFGCKE